MWGTSLNDLAKKAAEMQEQAAASIATPPAFNVGNMFNMDSLQNEEPSNFDKKGGQQSRPTSSSSYNPMNSQPRTVQQPASTPKTIPSRQPPSQSSPFLPNMASITPTNMSSALSFGSPTPSATPAASIASFPTANPFQSTATTPGSKGKLSVGGSTIPMKTTAPKMIPGGSGMKLKPPAAVATMVPPKTPMIQSPIKKQPESSAKKTTGLVIGGKANKPSSMLPNTATKSKQPNAIGGGSLATPKKIPASGPPSKLAMPTPISPLHKPKVQQQQQQQLPEPVLVVEQSALATAPEPVVVEAKAKEQPTEKSAQAVAKEIVSDSTENGDKSKTLQPQGQPEEEVEENPEEIPDNTQSLGLPKIAVPPAATEVVTQKTTDESAELSVPEATSKSEDSSETVADVADASQTTEPESLPTDDTPSEPEREEEAVEPAPAEDPIEPDNTVVEHTTPTPTTATDLLSMEMGEETANDETPLLSPAVTSEEVEEEIPVVPIAPTPVMTNRNEPHTTTEELEAQKEQFEQELTRQRQEMDDKIQQLQDQFSEQLQRLEENHHAETAQSTAHFEQALAHWQGQVKDREVLLETQSQQAAATQQKSNYDLESVSAQLKQAKELLADKEKEGRKLQEKHLKQLRDMEKQCNRKEDTSHSLGQEIQTLERELEESRSETQTLKDDHAKLKERAKGVAGELKEKRAECRTLASEIDLLKSNAASLQDRITQLEAQGMDMNQSSEETQEQMASLQSSLEETQAELSETQKAVEEEKTKGEEALAAYKKKAQSSLALANARSAAAIQAREEAEMEARAARNSADSAMQRAMDSEMKGKQSLMEAKAYVDEMKDEVAKYEAVKSDLEKTEQELKMIRDEAISLKDTNERLQCELTSLSGRLEAEQQIMEGMKQSLLTEQNRSNELYDEVERLRREGQRHQDEIRRLSEAKETEATSYEETEAVVRGRNAEADATIAMLQQELQDANLAIKDLKESLKAAMEEHEEALASASGNHTNGGAVTNGNRHNHQNQDNGMPLFYAMEKQAELSQARDEIARLANLLGDAESTKQEALDYMESMRRQMEDAQSRLKRQEQLKQSPESESVNLEYLKNIMLSYLNAGTPQEKKALLPVIGTVLCLTHEEQAKALDNLDKSNASVMGSVTSSVLNLKWS